jgi:hypothetical protein
LTEVLLALTVTALVGLAVVTMLSAASYGSTSRAGMRDVLVLSRTTAARIGLSVRTALDVVGVDAVNGDYIVLWLHDSNEDGIRQYDELELIERDAVTNELRSYTSASDATEFTTLAAFRATALASFTPERWATGITEVDFVLLAPLDVEAPLVSWRLTATRDEVSETAVGAVAVRNIMPAP